MSRRWWLLLALLVAPLSAWAQSGTTAVTALVKDSNGNAYVNCTWSVIFVGQSTTPGAGPYAPAALLNGQQGRCDSSGNLGPINLADNVNTVTPTPSQWQFFICSASGYSAGPYCFNTLITITGASQVITTSLTSAAPLLPALGNPTSPGGVRGNAQVRNSLGGLSGSSFYIDASQYANLTDAIAACPTNGGGNICTIAIPAGTYVGPSCPPSNTALVGIDASTANQVGGSLPGGGTTNSQVILQYTSTLTCTEAVNVRMQGIVLDFQANAAGLALAGSKLFQMIDVSIVRCGSSSVPCLMLQPTGNPNNRNTSRNRFWGLQISVNSGALGIQFLGTGAANAGQFATDNRFWDTFVTGANMTYAVDFELNTDSNYMWGLDANCIGSCTAAVAFNTITPGSDVDADGELVDGLVITGAYSSPIAAGASTGNVVTMSAATGATVPLPSTLGGSPSMKVCTISLFGTQSKCWINGKYSILAAGMFSEATGSAAGDMTLAESATAGKLFLGTDGGGLARSGSTISSSQSLSTAAQLASTVVTGTAPLSVASTTPVANLTVQNCSSCSVASVTNAAGIQMFNSATTCTTGASIGATCTTAAITLPVAYSDTNYRAVCTGQTATNVPIVQTIAKSNGTMTITIAALTAAAASFASYDCIVEHN